MNVSSCTTGLLTSVWVDGRPVLVRISRADIAPDAPALLGWLDRAPTDAERWAVQTLLLRDFGTDESALVAVPVVKLPPAS